jgi:hypothetical protein
VKPLFVKRLTDLHLPVQVFLAEYNLHFDHMRVY